MTQVLQLADYHIGLRTAKIRYDAFGGEKIVLERCVSIRQLVKNSALKTQFLRDIRGHEEAAMDDNSQHTRGSGG